MHPLAASLLLASALLAASSPSAFAQTNSAACQANATSRGNIVAGRTLSTHRTYPGWSREAAYSAATSALRSLPGVTITSESAAAGTFQGTVTPSANARPVPYVVNVTDEDGGARIALTHRLLPGMTVRTAEWAEQTCAVLDGLAPASGAGHEGAPGEATTGLPADGTLATVSIPRDAAESIGCRTATRLNLAERVSGTWSVASCQFNDAGSMVPANVYQFSVLEQRDVTFAIDAPGSTYEFTLYDQAGGVVQHPSSSFGVDFDRKDLQLAPGTYYARLRLSAVASQRRTGSFTLTTSTDRVGFGGCLSVSEIRLGAAVSGAWSVSDCKNTPNGGVATASDFYFLTVPAGRDVRISLASPALNAVVTLYTKDGSRVARADAFPNRPGTIRQQLAPGTYVVETAVSNIGEQRRTGLYTLNVQ